MPTIFSHPAVALGVAPWFRRLPATLLALGVVCSSLPDVDVISFALDVPYGHPLGHRGLTHSLSFAFVLAGCVAAAYRRFSKRDVSFRLAFAYLFLATASHGLLDAMTTGGRGVGFFIPFSNHRFFLPFRPIRVSPISASGFMARAGAVLSSELRWVWLPCLCIAGMGFVLRGWRQPGTNESLH
jgi:inner membrane protein